MLRAIGRNTVLVGAIAAGATVSGMAGPLLMSPRGAFGPGVLQADSLVWALAGVVISLLVSTAAAIVVGRVCNTVVGLFALGGGIFGLAWRMETIRAVTFHGSLAQVAVETFLWSLVVAGAAWIVFRFSGPLDDVAPTESGRVPHPIMSVEALRSVAAGLLALPVIWVCARSPDKGQMIGAVFCGGMVAGLAGRLLSPHVQPILIFAAPILFGAIAHAAAAATSDHPLREAYVQEAISPLNLPMPIDYACGSLLGVAVGVGWARSFLHHEEEAPA